ncbi:class I SAM-dependent methyltransferase [Streptomyces venezuelae]|uniref:class I SAM-dependent methyltransferase n=1 Tax=Streptomyces venezuelae TaxID=54571 RepID=UPI00378FA54D
MRGYDFSTEALAQARKAGEGPGLAFEKVDLNRADSWQPRPGSVDLVTCRGTLSYLNQPHILDLSVRALTPKGALYVLTPVGAPSYRAGRFGLHLTEEEITALKAGWASSRSYEFSATARALLLRGYGG